MNKETNTLGDALVAATEKPKRKYTRRAPAEKPTPKRKYTKAAKKKTGPRKKKQQRTPRVAKPLAPGERTFRAAITCDNELVLLGLGGGAAIPIELTAEQTAQVAELILRNFEADK
jgi:hypothetical protein